MISIIISTTIDTHESICFVVLTIQFGLLILMFGRSKATEDIDSRDNSSIASEQPQSKSFMVGGSSRTVTLNLSDLALRGKEHYKKQPYCVICLRTFTNFFRQHHCRVCANAVCGDCSRSVINRERACDLCVMRYSQPHELKKQGEIISTLQTLCAYLVYRRNLKMAELQALKSAPSQSSSQLVQQLHHQESVIEHLSAQNSALKTQREHLESELERVRQTNAQLEETIAQIERQMGGNDIDSYA